MNIKNFFKNIFHRLFKNDPVYSCKLYKERGCSHVDGILCDFPKCHMLKDYKKWTSKNS